MKSINPPGSTHTRRTRDAALRRLTRVNRWLIAGSALLTGVLTDVAANAFPGHKTTTRRPASRRGPHTRAHALKPPSAPPRTTTTQAAPPPETQTQSTPAPAESSPAPAEETHTAAPEPTQQAPAETPTETHEEAPAPAPERSEAPVVSGGS